MKLVASETMSPRSPTEIIQSEQPEELESYLNLSSFMPYKLNLLAHLVSRGIARIYEERHRLSAAQWRVMAAVAEQPGITAQEVVEVTPMDKVTVSRSVAALSETGLLQRQASKTDGRLALLSLTADGSQIYQQISPKALDYSELLQQSLSRDERQLYLDLTARLIDAATAIANQ